MIALVLSVRLFSSSAGFIVNVSWIHIHKYWSSFAVSNRLGGRDKCVRNRNDFVAFTNSKRQQSKPKRVSAIAHADCVGGTAECSELFFELFDERPAGKGAALDHFANSAIELFNIKGRDAPSNRERELSFYAFSLCDGSGELGQASHAALS